MREEEKDGDKLLETNNLANREKINHWIKDRQARVDGWKRFRKVESGQKIEETVEAIG
jgi:hypothetical protein